jgi:hypothetical protein
MGTALMSLEPRLGGLGCINLTEFICSLQCSWIKRAYGGCIDTWRLVLNRISGNNVAVLSPDMLDSKINPILYGIVCSFCTFKREFLYRNSNFFCSSIIGNPLLVNNTQQKNSVLNDIWLDNNDKIRIDFLKTLKVSDILNDTGGVKPIANMNNVLQEEISVEKYDRIKSVFKASMVV